MSQLLTPSGAHNSKSASIAGSTKSRTASLLSNWSTSSQRSVVESNGLSITERFFFKTAPDKQQVLMCIALRVRMPKDTDASPARIVDLVRIAQAKHYRLSSWVDHSTLGAVPFCDKAKDLPTNY
ncbi:hypothetical protein HDU80_006859, partial [Chytriomyces hyalinus]